MNWTWTRTAKIKVITVERLPLAPTELRAAFNVATDNKLWRAMLQLIREVQEETKDGAEKSVANHGICASCVGGGEFLTRLRDRMILEREAAIKGEPIKQ
jgi:hypothetical protein